MKNASLNKLLVALFGVALIALAYRAYGWAGVAIAASGVVMWVLLNFTRSVTVLQRASRRPIGFVDSAVMLNARLKPRVTLLHTVALTRALGQRESPENQQPEIWRWTDAGGSYVTCEFQDGKLARWQLVRPPQDDMSDEPGASIGA